MTFRVAVLMGGTNEERRVSLASGAAVCGALRDKGHGVVVIDPATGLVSEAAEPELVAEAGRPGPPSTHELEALAGSALGLRIAEIPELLDADVAFLALHGRGSEDGQLQAILDTAGVCYTGAGMLGSMIAFDKRVSKELLHYANLRTPDWAPAGLSPDGILAVLGLPLVVKPSGGGSTVGLTVVREEEELEGAIQLAQRFGSDVLVESFIPGRELTVTILEGRALPAVEIVPGNEIYDYEAKYTPGLSEYLVPAPLEPEQAARLAEFAVQVQRTLRLGSYGRIDFLLDDRDESFSCLEANSLPGLTATSLVPKSAGAAGISFPGLCERIALSALRGQTVTVTGV